MKKIFTIMVLMALLFTKAIAQDSTMAAYKQNSIGVSKAAADLKTGQANDILTNVYQLALKNVFGNKKEVAYSSTIFGLLKSVKTNYHNDDFYKKTRWTRNVELSVAGRIDSMNHINGFGGGIKFYIKNKRDITDKDDELGRTMLQYHDAIVTDMVKAKIFIRGQPKGDSLMQAYQPSIDKFNKSFKYQDLDSGFRAVLKNMNSKLVEGNGLAYDANQYFTDKIKEIKQRPLWSLGGNYYHSINSKTDTLLVESKFLVGLGKDKGNGFWEFNASANLKLFNNAQNESLAAQKFHFETGFNRVLNEGADGTSNMELKFFGSYDRGFKTNTIPTATMANLTYRYLVSQFGGFWIPVTLSYDPGKGKFLGFIDLTFNIDPVKK